MLSAAVLSKHNILFIKSRIIKANSPFEFFVLCKNKSHEIYFWTVNHSKNKFRKKQTQNEQKIKWFAVFLNYIKTYFIGSKTVKWNCAFIIIGGNDSIIMWLTEQIKSPHQSAESQTHCSLLCRHNTEQTIIFPRGIPFLFKMSFTAHRNSSCSTCIKWSILHQAHVLLLH